MDAWLSPVTESGPGKLILVAAVLPLLLDLVVQRREALHALHVGHVSGGYVVHGGSAFKIKHARGLDT